MNINKIFIIKTTPSVYLKFIFICLISSFLQAQQTEHVDFKTAKASIRFGDLVKKEVFGTVNYEFDILKDTDSIYLDAKNFESISYVLDGSIQGGATYNGNNLVVKHPFKANSTHNLQITWHTKPKKAMYFIDWDTSAGLSVTNYNKQIWTQGQGKYTSNWFPSIDDMNDKIEFDLSVSFNKDYTVIANGTLVDKQTTDSTTTWHYDMKKPMSSYLVALAIGKYTKKIEQSKSGIPLELYYYPQDSLKFEPTYRYSKQIFDFLENEIGVPYPWDTYKQVPVKDFLYAGMENTGATIFSDAFVIDEVSFIDKNYVNVNAHELAHQWFGDLVTETSGTHHWLHEGFATYYALLAEREIFGDDYFYFRLYEYAQELLEQDKAGQSTSLLDPKSSSSTFYKKGAWVLCVLHNKVGDNAFKDGIKAYLLKHQLKNVETNDLISEIEKSSGLNLNQFVEEWLKSPKLHYDQMLDLLKSKSESFKKFAVLDCEKSKKACFKYLKASKNVYLKAEVIKNLNGKLPSTIFDLKDVKIRQAIAESVTEIPQEQKKLYESLLNDSSYKTKELALISLWKNFPREQVNYLNKTRDLQGFNDKNIRVLWLTLAFVTAGFEVENKSEFLEELLSYTKPNYDFETRLNAFQYLNYIQSCNDVCRENLQQATKHHNWQFSKFAKNMLESLK